MTSRDLPETTKQWLPTPDQREVVSLLAQGYSQNAVSRMLPSVPQQTISYWLNGAEFAEQFRAMVQEVASVFRENLEAVEDQDTVLATSIIHRALSGELQRDSSGTPLQYDAAVELLRATRWKIRAQGGHKQFGAS